MLVLILQFMNVKLEFKQLFLQKKIYSVFGMIMILSLGFTKMNL